MMKKIQNIAAIIFIACVGLLSVVSILGIWDFFSGDVITKSFQTVGLLGVVAVIIIVAGSFADPKEHSEVVPPGDSAPVAIDPIFTTIRHTTLGILICAVAILALIGVLSIWDVLSGKVINKTVASIGVLVFSSLIIGVTCLEREQHRFLHKNISGGKLVLTLAILWIFWWIFGSFIF